MQYKRMRLAWWGKCDQISEISTTFITAHFHCNIPTILACFAGTHDIIVQPAAPKVHAKWMPYHTCNILQYFFLVLQMRKSKSKTATKDSLAKVQGPYRPKQNWTNKWLLAGVWKNERRQWTLKDSRRGSSVSFSFCSLVLLACCFCFDWSRRFAWNVVFHCIGYWLIGLFFFAAHSLFCSGGCKWHTVQLCAQKDISFEIRICCMFTVIVFVLPRFQYCYLSSR